MELLAIPIITGLIEVIKPLGIPSKCLPLLSVALGVIFGIFFYGEPNGIVIGIIFGLASSGLFDFNKDIIQLITNYGKK